MSDDTIAFEQFAGFFRRWQEIEDAKGKLGDESKDLFADMKGGGYDTKATRAVFRDKRKELNADPAEVQEQEAMYDLYMNALNKGLSKAPARPAPAHVENIEKNRSDNAADITMRHTAIATDLPPHDEDGVIFEDEAAPGVAAEATGTDLREPVAAEQGQIIREGDAPRETDCQAGEISQGGSDASGPDTEFNNSVHVGDERTEQPEDGLSASGDNSEIEHSAPSSQVAASAGELSTPTSPAVFSSPAAVSPRVDDGQPDQSSDEVPSGQGVCSHSGQSGQQTASAAQDRNEPVSASGASATISSGDSTPFIFGTVKKTAADYRPHCQNPEVCAASGLDHCYSCKKSMSRHSQEVAA